MYLFDILGELDRETNPSYTLVVQAIDRGNPPLTGQAVVYVQVADVNDQSPYFEPAVPAGEVLEKSPANIQVLQLKDFTFDDDIPPNQVRYLTIDLTYIKSDVSNQSG